MRLARNPVVIAALAGLLAAAWLYTIVRFNYHSNWTALFCAGSAEPVPAALASEHVYLFPNSPGYDGQVYHYIAHDPFFRRGFITSVDAPRLRWRRILIPGLAYLLALGQDSAIDAAYFAVVLAFVFLGALWLAQWSVAHGQSALWGLVFLVFPPVVVSLDRMTVDGSLAALCVGFVLALKRASFVMLWCVLAAAALSRETGFALLGGYCLHLVIQKDFSRALLYATAAIPALAWFGFVQRNTGPDPGGWLLPIPLYGYVERILHPFPYPPPEAIAALATTLDYLALIGMGLAIVAAIRQALLKKYKPEDLAVYLYALLAIFLSSTDAWSEVFAFGRTLAPLLILIGLRAFPNRSLAPMLPLMLVVPRVGLQVGGKALAVVKGLLAG